MYQKLTSIFLCFLLFSASYSEAAIVFKNGRFCSADDVAVYSLEDHFAMASEAYEAQEWGEAMTHFRVVTVNFANCPCAKEAFFFLGVSYFFLEEYEFANEAFSQYVKCQNNPKYFEEALLFKFQIAEKFRCGARRRVLGWKSMPRWLCADKLAKEIYDEIIATVPCHEIAVHSLYSKGCMLTSEKEYRDAIDNFVLLIRRFPKHELTPLSYFCISNIYLEQCVNEFQNPDLLALSLLNLKKFRQEFPSEELVDEVEANCMLMKELYAEGLYKTALFYERICKPHAARIYYQNAIDRFPETKISLICRERSDHLGFYSLVPDDDCGEGEVELCEEQ